ncbi:MAG: stage III sporulation protein AC [Clostridia bacterium]|nr:stage III sporulation protein AC [Clostridia bacterium]
MQIEMIFKVAAVGVMVAVLSLLLSKSGRDEQALLTVIAGMIVVLTMIVKQVGELFALIRSTFGF